jgi:rubrerythrin
MKKLLSLLVGAGLLVAVQAVLADDMGGMKMDGMSTPMASTTPVEKAKVKKTKKAKVSKKKDAKETWVCPMGHYSGPKTSDGKCPKCGMGLVEKK